MRVRNATLYTAPEGDEELRGISETASRLSNPICPQHHRLGPPQTATANELKRQIICVQTKSSEMLTQAAKAIRKQEVDEDFS